MKNIGKGSRIFTSRVGKIGVCLALTGAFMTAPFVSAPTIAQAEVSREFASVQQAQIEDWEYAISGDTATIKKYKGTYPDGRVILPTASDFRAAGKPIQEVRVERDALRGLDADKLIYFAINQAHNERVIADGWNWYGTFMDKLKMEICILKGFDTKNITYTGEMFKNCESCVLLDLSYFNFSNLEGRKADGMFTCFRGDLILTDVTAWDNTDDQYYPKNLSSESPTLSSSNVKKIHTQSRSIKGTTSSELYYVRVSYIDPDTKKAVAKVARIGGRGEWSAPLDKSLPAGTEIEIRQRGGGRWSRPTTVRVEKARADFEEVAIPKEKVGVENENSVTDEEKKQVVALFKKITQSAYFKKVRINNDGSIVAEFLDDSEKKLDQKLSYFIVAKDLHDVRQKAIAKINGLPHLQKADKQTAIDKINATKDKGTIQNIVGEAELDDSKIAGTNDINALKNLSSTEKSAALAAVKAATTTTDVTKAVNAARDKDAASLAAAKNKAKTDIGNLPALTEVQKANFKTQVEAKQTIAEVNDVVKAALEQDKANTLQKAKDNATNDINTLKNLSDTEKADALAAVKVATTTTDITKAVNDARDKDTANLNAAKDKAKTNIGNLTNLSEQEKTKFKDQVDSKKTMAEVNDIVKAAAEQDKAAALQKAKDDAIKEINALKNLSSTEKTAALAAVKAATTTTDVTKAVSDASDKDANNLTAAKNQAKTDIENLPALSKQQKTDFKSQVEAKQTIVDVNAVVQAANEQDKANTLANNLQKAKDNATNDINALKNLSSTERDSALAAIKAATTTTEVTKAVNDAHDKDAENLKVAKTAAKVTIDKLNNLTEEQRDTFKSQVDQKQSTAEVNEVVKAATEQDDAITLQKAKDAATQEINGLKNLSDAEKTDALDTVTAAATTEDVTRAVNDARDKDAANLKAAKDAAKADIDKLPNLSDADKQAAKKKVDAATDTNSVTTATQEAQKKNNEVKPGSGEQNGTTPAEKNTPQNDAKTSTKKTSKNMPLPKTGDTSSMFVTIGMGLSGLLSVLAGRKKKN